MLQMVEKSNQNWLNRKIKIKIKTKDKNKQKEIYWLTYSSNSFLLLIELDPGLK